MVERGIRFPSEVVIERRRFNVPVDTDLEGGHTQYVVRQEYSDYRFYSTKTTEQFLRFIDER